jgi:hypothetical protein
MTAQHASGMVLNMWPKIRFAVRTRAIRMLDKLDAKLAAYQRSSVAPGAANENSTSIWLRRGATMLAAVLLILAGIPMLVLPGPGILAILLGLSLLAGQFGWARRVLLRMSVLSRQALAGGV